MFRAIANTTAPTSAACRLFFIQVKFLHSKYNIIVLIKVRNTAAAAASKTDAPDTKKLDLKHSKRETHPHIKTVSIYRWVIFTSSFF
jgi:hypothetical protein